MDAPPDPDVVRRGAFLITADRERLDVDFVVEALSRHAYWALGRPREVIERSLANSMCFSVFDGERQVGIARVVTDHATFAWLCDVFIDDAYRSRGLGSWLVATIVAHPDLKGLRRFILATRDAHDLYRVHGGFLPLAAPERWMERST